MNKTSLLLFLSIIFLVNFSRCKKCTQVELANLKFTINDLSINPYSGNEGLVFKNLSGASIVFPNGKRTTSSFTHYQNRDAEYTHDCKGNYYTDETDKTDFYTKSGTVSPYLGITLGFTFAFNNPISEKYIFLEFFSPTVGISGFYGYYLFDNDSIYNYYKKFDTIVAKHINMTIGPRTYTNVYELYAINVEGINPEWFSIAYFTINEGFCGFKTNYGNIWYLDK